MMGGYGDVKLLNDDGTRLDGRTVDEMRPVEIKAGILPAAQGSAGVKHGLNVAVVAVYGPMEAHPAVSRKDRAVLDVRYNGALLHPDRSAPASTPLARVFPKVTAKPSNPLCC
ncbi:MAG: hypothetical protein CM15mP18_2710 [Methanobacteriota archaeon]|nr:MAG: hypothetical protein CM15mP18_2710 [Euryarchaeota archaeon]